MRRNFLGPLLLVSFTVAYNVTWRAPEGDAHIRRLQQSSRRLTIKEVDVSILKADSFGSKPTRMDVTFTENGKTYQAYFAGTEGNEFFKMPRGIKHGMKATFSGHEEAADKQAARKVELRDEVLLASAAFNAGVSNEVEASKDKRSVFVVDQFEGQVQGSPSRRLIHGGNAQTVKAVVVFVNVCSTTLRADVTTDRLQSAVFSNSANSFKSVLSECSHNGMGAEGSVMGPYDICPSSTDLWGLYAAVEAYMMSNHRSTWDGAFYKIMVFPAASIPAVGVGTVGGGLTWYGDAYVGYPQLFLHEIGHNWRLHHAATAFKSDEYGDTSCAMGWCCATRCYNFIHNWQLGFVEYLTTLTVSGILADSYSTGFTAVQLPAQGVERASGVKIVTSPRGLLTDAFLVMSYRHTGTGFDRHLSAQSSYSDSVQIHHWDGDQTNSVELSFLLHNIKVGQTVLIKDTDKHNNRLDTDLKVSFVAASGSNASVRLCRRLATDTEASPTVCAAPITADYISGIKGSTSCPAGSLYVQTETECNSARSNLGIGGYNGESLKSHSHRLPYCWIGSGGKANFNPNGDSGSNYVGSTLICTKATTTTTTMASYIAGIRGSTSCPDGYWYIPTEPECNRARSELGVGYNGEDLRWDQARLPYCWLGSGGRANFNPSGDSGWDYVGRTTLICKKTTMTTTTTTTVPPTTTTTTTTTSTTTTVPPTTTTTMVPPTTTTMAATTTTTTTASGYVEYDNYCVHSDGSDGSQDPGHSLSTLDLCKSKCDSTSGCTGIEWYAAGWDGNTCFLFYDAIAKGSSGSQWKDAKCYVSQACLSFTTSVSCPSRCTWNSGTSACEASCERWATTGWHKGSYEKVFLPTASPDGVAWTWEQCAERCALEARCEFWTLQLTGDKQCLMMSNKGTYHASGGHAEGTKNLLCVQACSSGGEENPLEASRAYSSVWNNDAKGAWHARSMVYSNTAWCAGSNSQGQWMQIDLGQKRTVLGVVTQGRADGNQWVTRYQVKHSEDNLAWSDVPGTITGNNDRNTKVTARFQSPISARYVRLVVQAWTGHISMRAAALTCEADYISGIQGSTSCPAGHSYVTTEADCNAARSELGIVGYNGEALRWDSGRLPYCWIGTGGRANFNRYGNTGWRYQGRTTLICKKASYISGIRGSASCPAGSSYIQTEPECNQARSELGVAYNGEGLNRDQTRLPYCWIGSGGRANFNRNGDSGWDYVGRSTLICKKASTSTAATLGAQTMMTTTTKACSSFTTSDSCSSPWCMWNGGTSVCEATCASYTCTSLGWEANLENSNSTTVTEANCCQTTTTTTTTVTTTTTTTTIPLNPGGPWTGYFDSEASSTTVKDNAKGALVGFGCTGNFCSRIKTNFRSDVEVSDLGTTVQQADAGNGDMMCNDGQVATAVTCLGNNCDAVRLHCAWPKNGRVESEPHERHERPFIPSNLHGTEESYCVNDTVAVGVQCDSAKCARVMLRCAKMVLSRECLPHCDILNLQCGDDGCGGTCGSCGDIMCNHEIGRCIQVVGTEWAYTSKNISRSDLISFGLGCQGGHCSKVQLIQKGLSVDGSVYMASPWISDNVGKRFFWQAGDQAESMAADCPDGMAVTWIECGGIRCDNIRFFCAKPLSWVLNMTGDAVVTDWFSEEQGRMDCPSGQVLTGMECEKSRAIWQGCISNCGDFCDNKRLRCRPIIAERVGKANLGVLSRAELPVGVSPVEWTVNKTTGNSAFFSISGVRRCAADAALLSLFVVGFLS